MMILRKKEVQQLLDAYQTMCLNNRFQIRFVCGEAGTGKSVLVNQFLEKVSNDAEKTLFVSSYCSIRSEYNIPYQPFKELLKQLLSDVKEEEEHYSDKLRKNRIKEVLTFCAKTILEQAPDLVGNFIPGVSVLSAIGQNFLKEKDEKNMTSVDETKILEQYVDAIRAIALTYKLVFVLDDLQWIDNSSVNLLYQLIVGLQNSPVFIIGSYRSTDIDIAVENGKHPLSKLITEVKISQGNVFLNLDLLDENSRKAFMNAMLDSEKNIYDSQFRDKLFQRTAGNPLFVSELLNLLKEEGMVVHNHDGVWMNNANLHWKSYPVRIEGIIQERIGRLEDSLVEILSHASIQGYNFIAQVLSKTMGEPERNLLMTLSKTLQKQHHLVAEGNCIRSSQGIVSQFNFSNYIFQQYLYQELSMTQRMMLHSDTAGILEEYFKDHLEEVAGDIARHYELSGENEKALKYIRITIENMMQISAYNEASVIIKKGLDILSRLEETVDNKKEKLWYVVQLSLCYRAIKGWGSPEVNQSYKLAEQLSEELRVFDYLDIIYFGVWTIHLTKIEWDICIQVIEKYMNMSRKLNNKQFEIKGYIMYGNTYFWMGKLQLAKDNYQNYTELIKTEPALSNPLDNIFLDMFSLLIEEQKNIDADTGPYVNRLTEIVNEKGKKRNPFLQAVALQALSWYSFLIDDIERLSKYAAELINLSQEYGFEAYIGIGKVFYGSAVAKYNPDDLSKENLEKGAALVKEGYKILTDHCRVDPAIMYSIYALALGKIYLEWSENKLFIDTINPAIEKLHEKNEKCYLSELYQLKAKYHTTCNELQEAHDCAGKAYAIAQETGSLKNQKKIQDL